jgi:hypothetical protein
MLPFVAVLVCTRPPPIPIPRLPGYVLHGRFLLYSERALSILNHCCNKGGVGHERFQVIGRGSGGHRASLTKHITGKTDREMCRKSSHESQSSDRLANPRRRQICDDSCNSRLYVLHTILAGDTHGAEISAYRYLPDIIQGPTFCSARVIKWTKTKHDTNLRWIEDSHQTFKVFKTNFPF